MTCQYEGCNELTRADSFKKSKPVKHANGYLTNVRQVVNKKYCVYHDKLFKGLISAEYKLKPLDIKYQNYGKGE